MLELYSEESLQQVTRQLRKRYLLLGVILVLLLGLVILAFIRRLEVPATVLVFLFCAAAVFSIDMFCMPLHRYRRLILSALTGRTHTETLEFDCAEEETSVVDGVVCRGLLFLGEPDKHGERGQRFYWDMALPLPAFRPGSRVTLKYTGRNIIGYQEEASR